MKLLQVISEVIESEIYLVPIATMIVDAVKSCRWSLGALMNRVLMALEVIRRRKAGIRSLTSLFLAFERFGVLCLMFSLASSEDIRMN